MTIRSAPPSSSPLAEMPVPAPAPMMGSPRAFMARKRARMSERGTRGMSLTLGPPPGQPAAEQPPELGDDRRREARIVDVLRHADEPARARLPNGRFERAEQFFIGIRIRERAARRVERRYSALRQEEAHRPIHQIEPFADPASQARVFLRRGAH